VYGAAALSRTFPFALQASHLRLFLSQNRYLVFAEYAPDRS
jgi:hypothetical protein